MKRILFTFLILVSALSSANAYHEAEKAALQAVKFAPQWIGRPFWIPVGPLFSSPDGWQNIYPLLRDAAEQAGVNLIRTSFGYDLRDKPVIVHYVLLTGPTRLDQYFELDRGRFLSPAETQQAQPFLSTATTTDPHQVGVLRGWRDEPLIEIRPLQRAEDYLWVEGLYWVEAATQDDYDRFVNLFVEQVNRLDSDGHYTARDFIHGPNVAAVAKAAIEDLGVWGAGYFQHIIPIRYLIVSITLVLVVYYSFHNAKRIGILKLHGVSTFGVWYLVVGRLIVLCFLATSLTSLAVALVIHHRPDALVTQVLRTQAIFYGLVLLASMSLVVYSHRLRIHEALKNRRDTSPVLAINTLLKAVWSLALMLLISGVLSQYAHLREQHAMLQQWKRTSKSSQYGIFYPLSVGHDLLGAVRSHPSDIYVQSRWLYPILNRQGAIVIDATEYEAPALRMRVPPRHVRSIRVNPNYLRQFPLYDTTGHRVQISESTRNRILLVPERYRGERDTILRHFREQRRPLQTESDGSKDDREHPIEIIWLANGQRVVTLNPKVFPEHGNAVVDPVIEVITESNAPDFYKGTLITGGMESPLKVPLINGDAELTMRALTPLLRRLKLSDHLRGLLSIDEAVAKEAEKVMVAVRSTLFIIAVLVMSWILLVMHNVTICFARYRRRFLIRRLVGVGFLRTYKEYFLLFGATWCGQLAVALLPIVTSVGNQPVGTDARVIQVLVIALAFMIVELLASGVAILRAERRNMAVAVKEGM